MEAFWEKERKEGRSQGRRRGVEFYTDFGKGARENKSPWFSRGLPLASGSRMHSPRLAFAVLPMVALASCQVGRDFKPPDLKAPAAFHGPSPPDAGTASLVRWWANFGDPVLSARVEAALADSPDMQAAQARVRASRALAEAARGGLWPSVQAGTAWFLRSTVGAPARPINDISVDAPAVGWDLDLFGGARRGLEAARAADAGVQWRFYAVRVALAADTARQELLARGLSLRLRIAKADAADAAELLEWVRARQAGELDTEASVAAAKAQFSSQVAQLPPLEVALAGARHRLAVLVGRHPGTVVTGDDPLPAIPDVPAGLPVSVLRRRPDVALAEAALHEATARIGIEEADLYPHASLGGGIRAEVRTASDVLKGSSYNLSLGPSVNWRLLERPWIQQRVKAAGANAEAALHDFDATVLRALEEAENALTAMERGRQRVAALEAAARDAKTSAALARAAHEEGRGDFTAVLAEQQRLHEVRDALAEAQTIQSLNVVGLYQALGAGWEGEKTAGKEGKP